MSLLMIRWRKSSCSIWRAMGLNNHPMYGVLLRKRKDKNISRLAWRWLQIFAAFAMPNLAWKWNMVNPPSGMNKGSLSCETFGGIYPNEKDKYFDFTYFYWE